MDLLDTYREMCSDLRDYYMSSVNARINEVMKVLTIIATIFIPLSFIAGVYGMNFNTQLPGNMPELNWPFGYVFALLLMGGVGLGLVVFIWRKGWLSRGDAAIEHADESEERKGAR
jgi:magnesium transporter